MSFSRLSRPQHLPSTSRQSNEFEPDDEWKRQVRDRIRGEAQRLNIQSVQNLRDDWLKRSGDMTDPSNDPGYLIRCDEINRDIQRWANEEYRNELERETNVNRLMAGQDVSDDWAHLIEEQQAILSQFEAEKARKVAGSKAVEREMMDVPADEPFSPDLGASSQVNFADKPSGPSRLSATERELGTPQRRSSPLNQDDMFSPTSQSGSFKRSSYPSRRSIPEFWTPPPEEDTKPIARRGSNASVRSVGSNSANYRAPTAPATIPERGPLPPEAFERTTSVGNLPSHQSTLSGSTPVVIQQDPSARIERNRAGSVNSNRSINTSTFPDRGPLIERNSPLPSSPEPSGVENAYFSRPPTNPRPNVARQGPVVDLEFDRPAPTVYRTIPERSPAPPFQPPPPPYQPPNTTPHRERYDRGRDPVEWRDRKLSNPESIHYVRPDYDVYPPQEMPRKPTIDTRYVQPEYGYDSDRSPATYYNDYEAFSPEEEFAPPVRTASRMKFNASGWVKQNGMSLLPPEIYRDWKSASSSYNMDDFGSLPPKERKLWLWIEDNAYKLELEQQDLQKKQEKIEREKEEAKRREEVLRKQEDDLKRREYDLLFRQREVEMTAKFREKEDELKWREQDLARKVEEAKKEERRLQEEQQRKAQDDAQSRVYEEQRKKADEEARFKAEEEDKRQTMSNILQQMLREQREEEDRQRRAEEERKRYEEEELRRTEEERRRREEALLREEEERTRREEERRIAEERKRRDEQRRAAEEAERRRIQEIRRREEEQRLRAEEEQRLRAEEEQRRRSQEERRRQIREEEEEENRKWREERKRQAEEARIREELRAAEERRRLEEEEEEEQRILLERRRRDRLEKQREEEQRKADAEREARELKEQKKKKAEEAAQQEALRKEREAQEAEQLRQRQEEDMRIKREQVRRGAEEEVPKDDDASRAEIERRRREEQRQREQEARLDAELNRLHEQARLRNLAEQGLAEGDSYPDLLNRPSPFSTPRKVNVPSNFGERPTATPTRSWENWGKSSQHAATSQPTAPRSTPQKPPAPTSVPKPSNPPSAPPPASNALPRTPISSAEWARRQAEHAKKQQEQFILEQERLERARQEKLAKTMTKEDVMQTFEWHERMWVRLAEADELTWDMFPWPMLKKPSTPEEITTVAIDAYVRSPLGPGREKSDKDRIKEHLRRWHPDRFEIKLLPRVEASQKELVKAGAGLVVRGLNELLSRSNTPGLFG